MFKPVKAHARNIADGQPSIRLGSKVPADAVNVAYVHGPALQPSQNVQITDTSGFILENAVSEQQAEVLAYANDYCILQEQNGNTLMDSRNFLLTNVFANNAPLYYAHEAEFPIVDSAGPDQNGFYRGNSISLVNIQGEPMTTLNYRIKLFSTITPKVYRVVIYTDFQTQLDNDVRIIYNAYKGVGFSSTPGYAEILNPQPSFKTTIDLSEVIGSNERLYYRAKSADVGHSQIYVPKPPVRDRATRTPVNFRFKVRLDKDASSLETPWIYDHIYGVNSLIESDGYINGYKRLRGKPADEIMAEFFTTAQLIPLAGGTYTAETDNVAVDIFTQDDGNSYVEAFTNSVTGTVLPPFPNYKDRRIVTVGITLTVNSVVTQVSVKWTDGIKELQSIDLAHSWSYVSDKATVFKKDGKLYATTEADDVYYAPLYSLKLGDSQQIKVLPPLEKRAIENWYPRIKNGRFDRRLLTHTGLQQIGRYFIPEYYRQNFDSYYEMPYIRIDDEQPEIVGDRKIKVRYTPLFVDRLEDATNITVTVNEIPASVTGWNIAEGTIDIDTLIKQHDKILVSYYYQEFSYSYRGYWDENTSDFWHLDLNPSTGHSYTDVNPDTGEFLEVPSSNLINKTIYIYIRAAAVFANDEMVELNRTMRASRRSSAIFHTFTEVDPEEEPTALLLARIQVRPNSSVEDISVVDTRVRGGGLKESISRSLMKSLAPESEHYWDIGFWDGEPYSENGVMIVRMPNYILTQYGGRFTQEEVDNVIRRHVGFGNLFIVEYVEAPQQIMEMPQNVQIDLVDVPEEA